MKIPLLLALSLISLCTRGQKKYQFEDFSEKYTAEIRIAESIKKIPTNYSEVSILDKKSNSKIITVKCPPFKLRLNEDGKLRNEFSTAFQDTARILYFDDFNFDSRKDLALAVGRSNCQNQPIYIIYLETDSGLEYSHAFTKLTRENCGMFGVDREDKKITTIKKIDCCWQRFSEYHVKNNEPVAMKIIKIDKSQNHVSDNITERYRIDGQFVEEHYQRFTAGGDLILAYSVSLENNKKNAISPCILIQGLPSVYYNKP